MEHHRFSSSSEARCIHRLHGEGALNMFAPISPPSWLNADHERTIRRCVIIAGIVCNATEWYHFAVYGYFAAIIRKHL